MIANKSDPSLDRVVGEVLNSPKYHTLQPGFIQRITRQELAKSRGLKDTVKAVKNRLHQVAGAYLDHQPNYAAWLDRLKEAANNPGGESLRFEAREMMKSHASTRERLPILDRFFAETLSGLPPIHSVLDLACGLNPLAIPWMGLAPGAEYVAVDIYADLMQFLSSAMLFLPVRGSALALDVVESLPDLGQQVDLALVLKTIPCLEQVDKSAGFRLLESIQADRLLVSFPARSLGGKNKGMPENYENRFRELVSGKPWDIQRYLFPSELVFLITKNSPQT